jgi:hypothetical protein
VFAIGKSYAIGVNGEIYNFVPYHHQVNNPKKSWWTENPPSESNLFKDMTINQYFSIDGKEGYNLLFDEFSSPKTVGNDVFSNKLFIAKFKYNNIDWHGYPGNHKKNKDKPDDHALQQFLSNGIDPQLIIRIKKGRSI